MVNVGLGWSSLVGIVLAAAGLSLYFLRSLRPKLARDHDIFFAAVALLCGGILFFQGWRQDPILQFGQFMLTGTAIFFAVESIRLRGAATEQAKRNTPVVDEERPVSRVYEARLDEFGALDDRAPRTRRIRGSQDNRANRDEYDEVPRRRSGPPKASLDDRYEADDRRRRPRPPIDDPMASPGYPPMNDDPGAPRRPPRTNRNATPNRAGNQPPTRNRRPDLDTPPVRAGRDRRPTRDDAPPSEYVDYRPIDGGDDDNWGDE